MTELRKLQMALLDIALEIKRICEKNKIPYILCGGSLLGAVRHNGFIPWDDDMDIAMLRDDYETFIDVCTRELDKAYFLQTYKTDNQYANSFAKLGICGTILINSKIDNNDTIQSISVDVFPIDTFPHSTIKKWLQYFREQNLCTAAYIKANYKVDSPISVLGKIRRYQVRKFAAKYTLRDIVEQQILLEKKYNQSKASEVGIVFFNENYVSRSEVTEGIEADFEGFKFMIPYRYDKILTGIYGNYMKLPPENERISHNFSKMNLGNYRIRSTRFNM